MKRASLTLASFLLTLFSSSLYAQNEAELSQTTYNQTLATQLGADEYGMKSYVVVLLKTGPTDAEITDETERAKLFAGHFANMNRLAEEGKLVLAGPFVDHDSMRGLLVLNVETTEEAEALVKTDPTVDAGIFVYEMSKLYSSAALMQVNEIHEAIQKTAF